MKKLATMVLKQPPGRTSASGTVPWTLAELKQLDRNVKRICGKTRPVITARVHGLRDEYTRTFEPARARAAETLNLERTIREATEPSV